jgi:hypothetical protein
LAGSLEAIEHGHSDIKKYKVGIQFRSAPDTLEPVTSLCDDFPLWLLLY